MIKTITFNFLLVFTCSITLAQNAEGVKHIETVKKELINSKVDTNRVLQYVDLCTAYQWTNSDSLQRYSEKGITLAQQLNYPGGEVRILNSQGIALFFQGNIPKALEILFKGLRIAEKNNLPLESAICLNSIGSCYLFLGDNLKSVAFINRARAIDETIQHAPRDLYWKIYIAMWSGLVYSDLNKLDSASFFLQKAYNDAYTPGFTDLYSTRPTILMFQGNLYFKRGNYEKALNCLHQSLETYDLYHDPLGTADVCTKIAEFFKQMNKPDSVIKYAKRGLDAAAQFNYKSIVRISSSLLADQYEMKDIRQAYYYLKLELAANDSLYAPKKILELQKTLSEEQQHQQQILEEQTEKQNRLKQNGLLAGLGVLLVIAFILFRNNRQKKKANILLQQQKEKVESTLSELKTTQNQLIQSEKMASLGELTAGIAHEIQNPLNFVNNFSEVSSEMLDEMNEELNKGDIDEAKTISNDIKQNLEKINHHGKRADAIVKGMLQHSRTGSGVKEPSDINRLADEYLRLAYQGFRARDKSFNATFSTEFDNGINKVDIVPQEIGRVILNLINNAFYAVNERAKQGVAGYEPTVIVGTRRLQDRIEISVKDNGSGIASSIKDKIFQPFFTTKPTGQGTGLGLSLAYDIVKAHGGEVKVETKENEGSAFFIILPLSN